MIPVVLMKCKYLAVGIQSGQYEIVFFEFPYSFAFCWVMWSTIVSSSFIDSRCFIILSLSLRLSWISSQELDELHSYCLQELGWIYVEHLFKNCIEILFEISFRLLSPTQCFDVTSLRTLLVKVRLLDVLLSIPCRCS